MKKTFLICFALFFCLITVSCKGKAKPDTGDFTCTFDDMTMTATVNGYTNTTSSEVTIPEKFGEYTVKAIGKNAFSGKYEIKKITLPSSLKIIDNSAFSLCVGLSDITLPEGLEEIGNTAFSECRSLKEAVIPKSVTKIGICAFNGCKSLQKITVDENNSRYCSDGYGVLFDKEQCALLQFPTGSKTKSYIVPENIEIISDYAFAESAKLENITLSSDTQKIASYAFYKSAVKEITLSENVTEIGSFAFSESDIENANLTSSLKTIGDSAFNFCLSLKSIDIPFSVEKIGSTAFFSCVALENINVDAGNPYYSSDENGILFDKNKTELIQYPLSDGSAEYALPNGVSKIHISAFSCAAQLEKVIIPASVSYIGDKAFAECPKLSSVVFLGRPPEKIGSEIFKGAPESLVILYYGDTWDDTVLSEYNKQKLD